MPTRRKILMTGVAFIGATSLASAQDVYPERPIKMLIGFPAGGTVDTIARLISPGISARLKQSIVIENRGGAAGALAVEGVVHGQPDGYLIILASAGALAVIPQMRTTKGYDPFKDLTPITRVASTPQLLVVGKHVAANSVQELVTFAKANPGKLTFGSTGNGSTLHLAGELFKQRAGVDILHVPYRGGGPAVTGMLTGEIDMLLVDIPVVIAHVESGAFKALGLASDRRISILPNVPTVAEAGVPGVIAEGWYAMYAPPGTPAPIVNTLQRAIAESLAPPETRQALLKLGAITEASTPDELTAHLRSEYAKWGEVIRISGAKMQ